MKFKFNPRVAYTFFSAAVILLGTIVAIQYAQGRYRFTKEGIANETGLLSTNSFPTGAQVYIDGRLVSATNDTLYLKPGEYEVRIQKEGYHPWQKNLKIEKTLVTQTNAQLFPVVPSLVPLTFSGVQNIVPSPDGQKLIFYTDTATTESKHGLYVLELTNSLLSLQKGATQIAEDVDYLDLAEAEFIWSPDSSEVMLITPSKEVILETNRKNNLNTLPDVSYKKVTILSEWEEEMYLKERQYLAEFPEEVIQLATASAHNVYLSPDKKRVLYTVDVDMILKDDLVPPVPATNTQPEERSLQTGRVYVYDREEDRNFLVSEGFEESTESGRIKMLLADDLSTRTPRNLEASPSAFLKLQDEGLTASASATTTRLFNTYHTSLYADTFQWFPDSKHLIFYEGGTAHIKSYDNTNDTTIFAGGSEGEFIYPWPDGSKLLILTSFTPDSPVNLYAVELK